MPHDDLIGLAYEGVIDNDPWSSFLHALRMALHSKSAMLMFGLPSSSTMQQDIDDSDWQVSALRRLYYARYCDLNPIRYQDMAYGQIYSMFEFFSREDFENSDYYLEFCRLLGIEHALIAYLGEADGVKAWLNVARGDEAGAYGPEDAAVLQTLVPHLNRAMRIFAVLKNTRSEKSAYMDTLDSIKLATLLLAEDGRIAGMNDLAEQLLAQSGIVATAQGQLRLSSQSDQAAFAALFDAVVHRNTGYGVMSLGEEGSEPLNLLLRRFEPPSAGIRSEPPFAAILYLKDPREQFHARAEAVAVLYGLKPTEARLAVAIASGASIKEAAIRLGMTEQTARTYVKRILQKTGVRRQADLVQLITSGLAVMV